MIAKRRLETFNQISMRGRDTRSPLTQSATGLTLLACLTVAIAGPALAQVPTFSPGSPSPSGAAQFNRLPPETPYLLGASDRVKMDVFDVQEYSGEYVILVDGTLNLPVIGNIPVRGLTIQQATDLISSRYARYVRRPIVTLSLVAPRPVNVALAGEVNRPGTYTFNPGGAVGPGVAAGQFPTLTQAMTQAGGITLSAAIGEVQIRRRTGPSTEQTYTADLSALLRGGNLSQDVILRDGDSILIPTSATVDPVGTRLLADASFASREIKPVNVAVVGEVNRPGTYAVTGGGAGTGGATGAITGGTTGATAGGGEGGPPTITKAIQIAGGITSLADIRSITLRRSSRLGEARTININLWDLLRSGTLTEDILLQEGDVITIPTATALDPAEAEELGSASFAPNTIVVNVVGEVTKPGAIPIPPNTPLNQAILAAGGFDNKRARKTSVELVRLNPNGTVEKRKINVDFANEINSASNPILRNNDVVIVKRSTLATVGDTLDTVLGPVTNFFSIFNLLNIFQ